MDPYPASLREKTPHGSALFPLAVYKELTKGENTERIYCHWHNEVELLLVLEGSATLRVNNRSYTLNKGCIALIPPSALHTAVQQQGLPFHFNAIVFHPDLLRSIAGDAAQRCLDPLLCQRDAPAPVLSPTDGAWHAELWAALTQICTVYEQKPAAYELLVKAKLYEACYLLCANTALPQAKPAVDADYRVEQAKEMMLYIRQHCDSSLTLAQMAAHFHISRGHLCRFFKEMTNQSPMEYVNYTRIQLSAEQLLHSTDEISRIAATAGFNNISYFNRIFRRYMLQTPTQFRARNKQVPKGE